MDIPDSKFKWLILPIETKVRELDGKMLLAAAAAVRGWAVVIGHKDTIGEDTAQISGVVIEKDANSRNNRIESYLAAGKRVCLIDEEGLVYLNSLDYYRRRLHEPLVRKMECFFLWGQVQQEDVLEHIKGIEDKLVLAGNPRFDLLRPELRTYYTAEAAKIKKKYGNFILINTNFADSNHFMGTEWVLETHRKTGFITNENEELSERAFISYQGLIVEHFKIMVRKLSIAFPEDKIIIRPHPSERHDTWNAIARKLKNVLVIHEGDVNAWLLACSLTIHNSCMTGIQSFLLNRPVISYMPVLSGQFDLYLPNALSIKASNLDDLISLKVKFSNNSNPGELERQQKMEIAGKYISAIHGPMAIDRILDALEALDIPSVVFKQNHLFPASQNKEMAETENKPPLARRIVKRLFRSNSEVKIYNTEKNQLAYSQQKFPGIDLADLELRMNWLASLSDRFSKINIQQIGPQSFCLFKD